MKKPAAGRPMDELLIDARFRPQRLNEKERGQVFRHFLNKLDWSKSASNQPAFIDDDLEFLLSELDPNDEGKINLLRADYITGWRYLVVNLALSHYRLIKAKSLERSLYNEIHKKELSESLQRAMLKAMSKRKKPMRNKTNRIIDTYFNWIKPHTQLQFANAIGKDTRTVARFLSEIGSHDGRQGHLYTVDVGLKISEHWLTKLLKERDLKEKFFHVEKNLSLEELKAALGTELLYWLEYKKGDEANRAREIIMKALPYSVAPVEDPLLTELFGDLPPNSE